MPGFEAFSSSNPDDALDAMTPDGWKPQQLDNTPSVTLTVPETYPVMEVSLEPENVEEIRIKITVDDDVVFDEPINVGAIFIPVSLFVDGIGFQIFFL